MERGYSERLLPGIGTWVLAASLVAMLAIAYGAAVSTRAGWLVACAAGAVAVALILVTAPSIRVDAQGLRVGRALLPAECIGACRTVDREELARARDGDARAYLMLRPLVSRTAVLVAVNDPRDPHPYWLVSTRHGDRLVGTLEALPQSGGSSA